MHVVFQKFPNGKVWPEVNGWLRGIARVPKFAEDDLETKLDFLSEEVTGSSASLESISWSNHGDLVDWTAALADFLEDDDLPLAIDKDSEEVKTALMAQFGLLDIEVSHLLDNLGNAYEDEHVITVQGEGRELRCPAYPQPCSYVRVTVAGLEVAYWTADEWAGDPEEVMGAILGATSRAVTR